MGTPSVVSTREVGASSRSHRGNGRGRAPVIVFGVVEVVAFAVWMIIGRSDWFYIDEWDFLAARRAGDLGDLFRSHNGHWTTLPILAFRVLYALFGLRTYAPYRIVIVVLYLTAAALLLVVMRRTGVQPWIATSAATFFALFGAGWENIVMPFQITFTGSLVFGLAYLLLADRDGRFGRRDVLALLAGLCALMCSAVGLVMVAVVVVVVLVRRGRQLALVHAVPLGACYAMWLVGIGHRGSSVGHFTASGVAWFLWTGLRASYGAIGPVEVFGVAIAIVLVAGLAFATNQRWRSARLIDLTAPIALLGGSLALLAITAVNRSEFGADWARQSRYVSLVGAMTLPSVAVAVDALAARWRRCLPLAIAVFVVGIPTNLRAATRAQQVLKTRDSATRATILSIPFDPLARVVPRSVMPEPTTAGAVTVGWLLDAADDHRLPDPGVIAPRLFASDNFRVSFGRLKRLPPTTNCHTLRRPLILDLHNGDTIGVAHGSVYLEPTTFALVGPNMFFGAADDTTIVALRNVGRTTLIPQPAGAALICSNIS